MLRKFAARSSAPQVLLSLPAVASFCSPALFERLLCFHSSRQKKFFRNDHRHRKQPTMNPDEKREQFSQRTLHQVVSAVRNIQHNPKFKLLRGRARKQQQQKQHQPQSRGGTNQKHQSLHGNKERHLFEWRNTFGAEITRLSPAHFENMSLQDMVVLLDVASALEPVAGSSHVANGVAQVLQTRLQEAELSIAVDAVTRLMRLHATPNVALVKSVALTMERLIENFRAVNETRQQQQQQQQQHSSAAAAVASSADDSATSPSGSSGEKQDISDSAVALYDDSAFLRRVILGFVARFNDQRCQRLFHEDLLRELVIQLLHSTAAAAAGASSGNNNKQSQQHPQTPIIAILAATICRLRLFDPSAIGFFRWAAPICVAEADLLSGQQLSFIMEAFSCVGYHHPALFVTLGTKAGELGELLREDEVARVLNAMSRTKIEHSKLRASLESSMRMKTIHKRTAHTSTMF